jgi:hypothetical protein
VVVQPEKRKNIQGRGQRVSAKNSGNLIFCLNKTKVLNRTPSGLVETLVQ